MVKRERDDSSPDYTPNHSSSRSPSPSPNYSPSPSPTHRKKAKKTPTKSTTPKAPGAGTGSKSVWDAARTLALLEAVFEHSAKTMDVARLADQVCFVEGRD